MPGVEPHPQQARVFIGVVVVPLKAPLAAAVAKPCITVVVTIVAGAARRGAGLAARRRRRRRRGRRPRQSPTRSAAPPRRRSMRPPPSACGRAPQGRVRSLHSMLRRCPCINAAWQQPCLEARHASVLVKARRAREAPRTHAPQGASRCPRPLPHSPGPDTRTCRARIGAPATAMVSAGCRRTRAASRASHSRSCARSREAAPAGTAARRSLELSRRAGA